MRTLDVITQYIQPRLKPNETPCMGLIRLLQDGDLTREDMLKCRGVGQNNIQQLLDFLGLKTTIVKVQKTITTIEKIHSDPL